MLPSETEHNKETIAFILGKDLLIGHLLLFYLDAIFFSEIFQRLYVIDPFNLHDKGNGVTTFSGRKAFEDLF